VNIIWDEKKNKKLIAERGLSFELVSELILEKEYVAVLENTAREGQYIFLIPIDEYIHVVPFVIDEDDNIILKTIYPSRKFHNLYGAKSHEKDTR
jgi:uncharacterized DUF497 family protein